MAGAMVHFMCQFGWATVPRHSVKHYSGYRCEGVVLDDSNIKISRLRVKQITLYVVGGPYPIS